MDSQKNLLPLADVIAFLEDRPGPLAGIVMHLRALVLKGAPEAVESIHWRALSYHDPERGGHVKGAICQITVLDDHVRLSFIHGAVLPDPAGLMKGDRKMKRYIALRSVAEVPERPLAALIRAAARLRVD